jgi:hypothetical protein
MECRRGWTLTELLAVILFHTPVARTSECRWGWTLIELWWSSCSTHLPPGERMPPGMDAD